MRTAVLVSNIIERRDHHYIQSRFTPDEYIQSRFTPGELVEVEHRRGGPDHHYGAVTADRQLAQRVLWSWATGSTDWESALQWAPMDFT